MQYFKQRLSCVTLLGVLTVGLSAAYAQPLTKVIVEPVEAWQEGISTPLYCVVETPYIYQLSSHANAELTSVLPVGTLVEKGDVLAKQDGFYLAREIKITQADIKAAVAEQKYAKHEYQRLKALGEQKMASESRLSRLQLEMAQVDASYERLKSQLQSLKNRFEHLEHKAPYVGQVVALNAQPGEQLRRGDEILQLLPIEQKQLDCKLAINIYNNLSNIEQLTFNYQGQSLAVRHVNQDVDKASQNVSLTFDYPANVDKSRLLVGQRIQLDMVSQKPNVTKVPYDALNLEGDNYTAWKINQNDEAEKIQVDILATMDKHFIVESSLSEGDRVVVRGFRRLKAAQKVAPVGRETL